MNGSISPASCRRVIPDEHVPHSAKLFGPTGTELTPDIESDHYASLTFAPGTPGTVRAVAGKRFTLDVTTQNAAGTGSVTVGFGHDVQADEASFGPFAVTVR